ncbi:MAG: hypothetical protein VB860_04695 [Dehalococcoidia bacterium]
MAASIVRWRLLIAVKRAGGIAEGEDIGNTPNIEILGTIVEQVNGMIDRVMEIPLHAGGLAAMVSGSKHKGGANGE